MRSWCGLARVRCQPLYCSGDGTGNRDHRNTLDLGNDIADALTEFPSKGIGPVVPTDPLIYRFYEIMQVYGMPMKAVIHEKFGDGIMSAIDFSLHIEKEPDPKGDRVKVTMSGKFLPYKKF